MSAHQVVDDLLSRRGLRSEDESKFLRQFEWVPVIDEEPPPPHPIVQGIRAAALARRSISSASDSGLSMASNESGSGVENEVDAGDCEFVRGDVREVCQFSVLMSSEEMEVERRVKMEKKREEEKVLVKVEEDKIVKGERNFLVEFSFRFFQKIESSLVLKKPRNKGTLNLKITTTRFRSRWKRKINFFEQPNTFSFPLKESNP
jgi:hypothetical protein